MDENVQHKYQKKMWELNLTLHYDGSDTPLISHTLTSKIIWHKAMAMVLNVKNKLGLVNRIFQKQVVLHL